MGLVGVLATGEMGTELPELDALGVAGGDTAGVVTAGELDSGAPTPSPTDDDVHPASAHAARTPVATAVQRAILLRLSADG